MPAITRIEDLQTLVRYTKLTNNKIPLYLVEVFSDNVPRHACIVINTGAIVRIYEGANSLYIDDEYINLNAFGFNPEKITYNRIFVNEQEAVDYSQKLNAKLNIPTTPVELAATLISVRFNYLSSKEEKDNLYRIHKIHYERLAKWILENYVPKV